MGRCRNSDDRASIKNDLNTLGEWSENNQMPFNVDKCKVMHLGRKNVKFEYKLINKK